jgi:hypothetical protein
LNLTRETHADGSEQSFHIIGLMSGDYDNVVGIGDSPGSPHHMFDQGQSTGAVEHLGALGSHARSETGR